MFVLSTEVQVPRVREQPVTLAGDRFDFLAGTDTVNSVWTIDGVSTVTPSIERRPCWSRSRCEVANATWRRNSSAAFDNIANAFTGKQMLTC